MPILLTWLGGVIAWFVWKDKNRDTAMKMLIVGIVFTFIWPLLIPLLFGAICCGAMMI